MSDPKPAASLTARLARLIERASEPDRPPPAAEPVPSPADRERAARREAALHSLEQVEKLARALDDRLLVLLGAARKAGLVPAGEPPIPAYLQGHIGPYASYLGRDKEAGRLVASVVMRYAELRGDVARAREAIERGDVAGSGLEAIRGKFLFLCKIRVYFKDHPMLQKFFAADPASISTRVPDAADRQVAGRYGGYKTPLSELAPIAGIRRSAPAAGTRPLAQPPGGTRPHGTGPIEPPLLPLAPLPATAKAAVPQPPIDAVHTIEQGGRLVRGLELKVLIVKAAIARLGGGRTTTGSLLPAPSQQTAENVAKVLAEDPPLLASAREFVAQYERARLLLQKRPPDLPALQPVLARMSTYPARVREVPVLGPLLAA